MKKKERIIKMKKHVMKLNQEPFNLIKEGKKTIEMRLNDEKRNLISVGDIIKFIKTDSNDTELKVIVKKLHRYENFNELYKHFDKVKLGYCENQIAMPSDMEEYYSKEDIEKYGVVGIEVEVLL